MMGGKHTKLALVGLLFGLMGSAPAHADSQLSVLSYNVAGLPELFSSADSDRQAATEQISCYVNAFDVVNVQEDFNYHAALYDTCNNHPHRSPTTGGMGFGSGLNSMSYYPYSDWERVSWNDCNGVDCLTPKGFTRARVRVDDGVIVDVYNLHAQAQVGSADLEARRGNILQLANYIEQHSAGHAVLILGDTNTRYTRSEDNIRELTNRGFKDPWIELTRNGSYPASGAPALACSEKITDPNCEIVDKLFYRGSHALDVIPMLYQVRTDDVNNEGEKLSDHPPVQGDFNIATEAGYDLGDTIGGPHGQSFNNVATMPQNPSVAKVTLRAGSRVDQVGLEYRNGYISQHGGNGGSLQSLTLGSGEYIDSATFCAGKKDGRTRIFYAAFETNLDRSISGGSTTGNCMTHNSAPGQQIAGLHGRSGGEVDKLGVIETPVNTQGQPAQYVSLKNQASNLCMDINQANMANGTNVLQWNCTGSAWQQWSYDDHTGLVRSQHDPRYCLDNGGQFGNGANLMIWECNGSANQQFTLQQDGRLHMRTLESQVVDGYGANPGDNVGTWGDWGGQNQRWTPLP
ncbi:MAG: jacalin-like lectin [Pseudomonadota bacterium]